MNLHTIKNDFLASIVVFLVAVPLCLGIALACGAPLFAGLLTGIIGGIVVGIISDSPLSVSGPAAGMIAVVLASINQLGSYEAFLMALTLAGVIQLIGGVLRTGFIANFVPDTVIKGLLAAIGILIILKQIPLAFGYDADPIVLQTALKNAQESFSIAPIFAVMHHINHGALIITLLSLAILILWEKRLSNVSKVLPSAVVVVVAAIVINQFFLAINSPFALLHGQLVNIPVNDSFAAFLAQFQHPDLASLKNSGVYISALMIAIVASLESLLNLEAVEKLDPQHRYTSRNRELVAQGCGNVFSGLLGGLPITSVIVRSSVNISAGAQSKLSAILHGFLLLLSLTFIAKGLNYIPLPALAAILIHTGYKLAKPSLFQKVYQDGLRYFIPFMITVVAIVMTNLLLGIVTGLIMSILFFLYHNSKNGFFIISERHSFGEVLRLVLPQHATFLNKAAIIEELNHIPNNAKVIIDADATDYIDHDVLHVIKEFNNIHAPKKNILLNLVGFKDHYEIANQAKFITATSYDMQMQLTPDLVLTILYEGNQRFVNGTPIHKDNKQRIQATASSQHPMAVILGCIDSRVPVEMIFDVSFGDVFVARVAGNIANTDILASIEFACQVAGAKLIVVLGHEKCGAVAAACDDVEMGNITHLVNKIKPAIECEKTIKTDRTSKNQQFLSKVIRHNVELTKNFIYEKSHILRELIDNHDIKLTSAIYDVENGAVEFAEHRSKRVVITADEAAD